jgi:hypothetical protein
MMLRVLAVLALGVLSTRAATADTIDRTVLELRNGDSTKVRLAAALALSKLKDARAVIAVADALAKDDDEAIRRVCALALEKMIDAHTAPDAIALTFDALDGAAARDPSTQVRQSAAKVAKALAAFRREARATKSDKPEVFVKIDPAVDTTSRVPAETARRLHDILKTKVEHDGYATAWPGGAPTSADLASSRSRAFVVASTVKKIDISRVGTRTHIACTLSIRLAPWSGSDGGEKWEAARVANALGSAKAVTGTSARDIQTGIHDCIEAVAEDLSSRQILPFLKRLVVASN